MTFTGVKKSKRKFHRKAELQAFRLALGMNHHQIGNLFKIPAQVVADLENPKRRVYPTQEMIRHLNKLVKDANRY